MLSNLQKIQQTSTTQVNISFYSFSKLILNCTYNSNLPNNFHQISIEKCYELNIEFANDKNVRNGYVKSETAEECQLLCQTTNPCRFFTFDVKQKMCWLKRSNEGRKENNNFISGKKYCEESGRKIF